MSLPPKSNFQALALTGGGYRGLFSAQALATIEASVKKPIGQYFDLICGTSIGGIIGLAAAFEIPMATVVKVFEDYGQAIFPAKKPPRGKVNKLFNLMGKVWKPGYSVAPLREVISKIFPADAILNDALHAVAIPAINVTQGQPQVFKTRHKLEYNRDYKYKVVDVALATSAAPTYFELAEVAENLFVDGGLFANAPDLIAIHEAEHFLQIHIDSIRLLSIGTTTKGYSISFDAGRKFGILAWMSDERLFSVMLSAQQQFVDQIVGHRLGSRYLRIDHQPSQEQAKDLGLDIATETARKTLKGLADKTITDILGNKLPPFLEHTPSLTIHR